MKNQIVFAAILAASAVYGGFWDTLNKVQKTVETVNAVGDIINGKPAAAPAAQPVSVPPAAETPQATATPQAPAPSVQGVVSQVSAIPAPDAAAISAFAGMRTTATDTAVPEVKYGTVYVKKPATPEQILEARNAYVAQRRDLSGTNIRFEEVDDATVAATLAAFHQASNVDVRKSNLTTLAPFALLRRAKAIYLSKVDCSDMKPLAGLAGLQKLSLQYCTVGDFTPLGSLPSLEALDLYGASFSGPFTPLAACPKLRTIDYYATKADPALYDSLGDLKQVKVFHGGLSKMTSLSWLRRVPAAEDLQIFAEKLDDIAAIGTVAGLKKFKGWNMCGDSMSTTLGDLSFLSACKNLEKVELPGSAYSNTAVLGTLPRLKEVSLNGAVEDVDLAFLRSAPLVEKFSISKPKKGVRNFDAVYSLQKLSDLDIQGVPGVPSLVPLQACRGLKSLTVSKNTYPQAEVDALDALIKGNSRYGKVRQY